MHRSAAVIALLCPVVCFASLEARAADIALHCERLFESRKAQVLGPHTVVVRDGKVAEVRAGRVEIGMCTAAGNAQPRDLFNRVRDAEETAWRGG